MVGGVDKVGGKTKEKQTAGYSEDGNKAGYAAEDKRRSSTQARSRLVVRANKRATLGSLG